MILCAMPSDGFVNRRCWRCAVGGRGVHQEDKPYLVGMGVVGKGMGVGLGLGVG